MTAEHTNLSTPRCNFAYKHFQVLNTKSPRVTSFDLTDIFKAFQQQIEYFLKAFYKVV